MIEVDVRAMKSTLMLTGSVPTEEHKAQADELASQIRGVKDVRNRLRVREADVAAGQVSDEQLIAKLDKKINTLKYMEPGGGEYYKIKILFFEFEFFV